MGRLGERPIRDLRGMDLGGRDLGGAVARVGLEGTLIAEDCHVVGQIVIVPGGRGFLFRR
jgi:hypothetical protein